jgi:BolA protein
LRVFAILELWGALVKKQENVSLDSGAVCADAWLMTMAETMRRKLDAAFAPEALEILDDSARHEGHAGARPGGETHFLVRVVSRGFEGLSRVERQRRIHATLAEELKTRVHALSIEALTPHEAARFSRGARCPSDQAGG